MSVALLADDTSGGASQPERIGRLRGARHGLEGHRVSPAGRLDRNPACGSVLLAQEAGVRPLLAEERGGVDQRARRCVRFRADGLEEDLQPPAIRVRATPPGRAYIRDVESTWDSGRAACNGACGQGTRHVGHRAALGRERDLDSDRADRSPVQGDCPKQGGEEASQEGVPHQSVALRGSDLDPRGDVARRPDDENRQDFGVHSHRMSRLSRVARRVTPAPLAR